MSKRGIALIAAGGLTCIVLATPSVGLRADAAGRGPAPQSFTDVAAVSNIKFKHDNAATPERYLIETMGSGAAWIDYDNDGYLDLYLVNSAETPAYKPERPLRSALYRNKGDGTFQDVTERAGVAAIGLFGMGVAVGDYDNDGFEDLFVAGYSRSILFHNNGSGTFTEVSSQAGVENRDRWASSAAWLDYDRDGNLDLVIANYVDFTPAGNLICAEGGHQAYCHPNKYHGQSPTLLHND